MCVITGVKNSPVPPTEEPPPDPDPIPPPPDGDDPCLIDCSGHGEPSDPGDSCDPTIPGSDCAGDVEYSLSLTCDTYRYANEWVECDLAVDPEWVRDGPVDWGFSGETINAPAEGYSSWGGLIKGGGEVQAQVPILGSVDSVASYIELIVCGDERDIIAAEYPEYYPAWYPPPTCEEIQTNGGSAHFSWSELNGGWADGMR